MRRWWWSGVAALGLVAALIGSAAAASAQTSPPTPTATDRPTQFQIAFVADGTPPVSGRATRFSAGLTSLDEPVPGVRVALTGRETGSTTYRTLARATTDAYGGATVRVVLHRRTALRWTFAGTPDYAPTRAEPIVTQVAASVAAHARDTSLKRPQRVVVGGRAGPGKAGSRVALWSGRIPYPLTQGPAPHRIAVATVRADGTFVILGRFRYAGTKHLYVRVAPGHGTAEGYSAYFRVRVR